MAAYSITDVEALDADGFKRYRELAAGAVSRCGGRFLVRGAEPVRCENPAEADLRRHCPVEAVAKGVASGISDQGGGARWPISPPLNGARR